MYIKFPLHLEKSETLQVKLVPHSETLVELYLILTDTLTLELEPTSLQSPHQLTVVKYLALQLVVAVGRWRLGCGWMIHLIDKLS